MTKIEKGDIVKLTGKEWPKFGMADKLVEVTNVQGSSVFFTYDDEDWCAITGEVIKVEPELSFATGGFVAGEPKLGTIPMGEYFIPKSKLPGWKLAPTPPEHPNFIQFYASDDDWDAVVSAYRDPLNGDSGKGWHLTPITGGLDCPALIKATRLVLDEIERRMIAEEDE